METPVSRSALYGKLAGPLFRSLESATAFCKLRSNPWVELTHWLHQLTQQPDIYSVSLLVAASSLMPIANAAEKLQTTLRVGTYFRAGHVPDGMVLAQGWVTYHGSHSGFRVWSDEQKAGNTPTVLLLSGQQDPRHHIQVRLEGEGWQPDTVNGRGAILRTAADNASFSVVVDGNQEVPADTWTLDFKACALAQENT